MPSYEEILRGAVNIAADAAATLTRMRSGPRDVNRKELRDVVTDADLASERLVLDGIRKLTPGAAILSEECVPHRETVPQREYGTAPGGHRR